MANPLVSVIVLAYNHESFIRDTLASTVQQDYDNLEVIVSDDGSSDGTVDVIQEYARRYPDRILPIIGKTNLGVTGNSNRGLQTSNGKYVAFLGGDDQYLPAKITRQVAWMEADERRVLSGHDVEIFDTYGRRESVLWSESHPMRAGVGPAHIIQHGTPFAAISVMVRRSAIPTYGFDPRLPTASDWKLWIDCLAKGGEFGFIDGVYARYRRSESNISINTRVMVLDRLVTLAIVESSYPEYINLCKRQRARAYYDLGISLMKEGKHPLARKAIMSATQCSLYSPKIILALLFAYFPRSFDKLFLQNRFAPGKFSDFIQDLIQTDNNRSR